MKSFHLNNIWTLIRRFVGFRLVGCKWIFKLNDGNSGIDQQRFKERLVPRGLYIENELIIIMFTLL